MRIAGLCGPTASGKTDLAVRLRQMGLPIECVNCDALQLYDSLHAGTAKPTADQLRAVPTQLVGVAAPTQAMTAGQWAEMAGEKIADISLRGAWPLVIGGSGLYWRALTRGLAAIPPVPATLRAELTQQWSALGPAALHAGLAAVDPDYAARTPPQNRQRVARALEVFRATGKPLTQWHREQAPQVRYQAWLCVLEPARADHAAKLAARAEAMAAPLLAEVRQLLAGGLQPDAPAMQALGYRDAARVVQGLDSAAGFAERLARDHGQYAKRQRTWFAAEPAQLRIDPFAAGAADAIAAGLQAWFTAAPAP